MNENETNLINFLLNAIKEGGDEAKIKKYEHSISKKIEDLYTNRDVYNLPIENLSSIISFIDFECFQNGVDILKHIIIEVRKTYKSLSNMLIPNIHFIDWNLSLANLIEITSLFKDCELCCKLAKLFDQEFYSPDRDYEYELLLKDKEIAELTLKIEKIEEKKMKENKTDHDSMIITKKPLFFEANIFKAVSKGKFQSVEYLIERNIVDKFVKNNDDGNTLLHIACKAGNLQMVKYFVEDHNLPIRCINNMNQTPLCLAMLNKKKDVYKYLIGKGETEISQDSQQNSYFDSVIEGDLPCIRYYIEVMGVLPDQKDKSFNTALHYACLGNFLDIVQYLVEVQHVSLNMLNYEEKTPLQIASDAGHTKIIQYLLKAGAYINSENIEFNMIEAAKQGKLSSIKYLIEEEKQDKNQVDLLGNSSLHYACKFGYLPIVEYLADQGAELNTINSAGETPLNIALNNKHENVVIYLLKKMNIDIPDGVILNVFNAVIDDNIKSIIFLMEKLGINPNITDDDGNSPLILACKYSHFDIIQYLIEKQKVNINAVNKKQEAAIGILALKHDITISKYLIEHGSVNIPEDFEEDIHKAAKEGKLTSIQFLVNLAGFDPKSLDSDGKTPFYYACVNSHIPIIKFLCRIGAQPFDSQEMNDLLEEIISRDQINSLKYLHQEKLCDVTKTSKKGSYLHTACTYNSIKCINYLIDYINPDILDSQGNTALHIACLCSDLEIVSVLVQKNFSLDSENVKGHLPLHFACLREDKDIILYIISVMLYDVDQFDKNGNALIHFACLNLKFKTIQFLYERFGANLNLMNKKNQLPLQIIQLKISEDSKNIEIGNQIKKYLIQNGGIEIFNNLEFDIFKATEKGLIQSIYLLCSQNTDIDFNQQNEDGNTLLHIACEIGNREIVQFLLERVKCNILIFNKKHQTPFTIALLKNQIYIYQYLIARYIPNIQKDSVLFDPFKAVEKNDLNSLSFLVSIGVNESIINSSGYNLLGYACLIQNIYVVKYLIQTCKFNKNCRNILTGDTILHTACRLNSYQIASYLINEENFNLFEKNKKDETPFSIVYSNSYVVLRSLINEKMEQIKTNIEENSVFIRNLFDAVDRDDLNFIKQFVTSNKTNPSHKGISFFLYAIKENKFRIVKYLVEIGFSIIKITESDMKTPFQMAISGSDPILQNYFNNLKLNNISFEKQTFEPNIFCAISKNDILSIQYNFIINTNIDSIKDSNGNHPIHFACELGFKSVVEAIIKVKPQNVFKINSNGLSPLLIACMRGYLDIVIFILNHGYDIDNETKQKRNLLNFACFYGHIEIVKYLVSNYDSLLYEECDENNILPIHYACLNGNLEIVKLLITKYISKNSNKQSLDIKDKLGRTPMHFAVGSPIHSVNILKIIAPYSNKNAVSNNGSTPLHIACEVCNFQAVRYLVDVEHANIQALNQEGKSPISIAKERSKDLIYPFLLEKILT